MTLSYEVDSKLKTLAPVLDEHADWYSRVMRRIFYPEYVREEFDAPASFTVWVQQAAQDGFIGKVTLDRLVGLHAELHHTAEALMRDVLRSGTKADFKHYDELSNLYDDFIYQLRRLEHDAVMADSGLDTVTGLRSRKAMLVDLQREMERRTRRGKPFCLVLSRIDNYESVRQAVTEERDREIVMTVARLIKKCIRSFDDAYRSGDGEFIMSLKHSDISGGAAAINRLQRFMDDEKIVVEQPGGRPFELTVSSCVAEPLPGDTLEEMLRNMRNDLHKFKENEGGTMVEYFEQSPLSRYVNEMDSKK